MFSTPEQFVTANKAFVDAMLSLTKAALVSAERIAALNLNAAHSLLEENIVNPQALSEAKDLRELMTLQAAQAKPIVEQVISYSRSLYEIAGQSKEDVSRSLERQFAEFEQQVSSLMEDAAKNAPAGSDLAFASVRSALAAVRSAIENMKSVIRQADDLTQTNVAKASSATVDAVRARKK